MIKSHILKRKFIPSHGLILMIFISFLSHLSIGQNILFSENFESGLGGFSTGGDISFSINSTYSHLGNQSAHNPHDVSNNNYLTQSVNMDFTGLTDATLKFWHIAKTEGGYDNCVVQVSEDGGVTWVSISPIYNEDDYSEWGTGYETPDNTLWREKTIDLTAYIGQNDIKIRFWLSSDTSANRYGWLIDDISVETTCVSPTADYTITQDCTNGQFSIGINVTSLGDATGVDITDGTTTYETNAGIGSYTAGPFTA